MQKVPQKLKISKKKIEFYIDQEKCSSVDGQRPPLTRLQFSRSTAACAFNHAKKKWATKKSFSQLTAKVIFFI